MSRRIYNINDLKQLEKFKEISQEDANKVLKLAYKHFTKEETHQFPKGITEIRHLDTNSQIVFEGKLIDICLSKDYYPIMFGGTGRNILPLKLEFRGDEKNWQQIDNVYFLFNNLVREQEGALYYRVIGWRKQQIDLIEEVKRLEPTQNKLIKIILS